MRQSRLRASDPESASAELGLLLADDTGGDVSMAITPDTTIDDAPFDVPAVHDELLEEVLDTLQP